MTATRTASFWAAAAGALVLLRYRGRIGLYRGLHGWLRDRGVPEWARNLDNEALLVVFGLLLWAVLRRGAGDLRDDLGLRRFGRGSLVGAVVALPMLVLGAVTGGISLEWPMVRLVLAGPFAEEWFFRGVLVLAFVRCSGVGFWRPAIAGGALFGLMHVTWTGAGFAAGWPQLLVTTAGGVWFAWLARAWGRCLWVSVLAHVLMNLAWQWFDSATWREVGRGATIALGTVWTIRAGATSRSPSSP